MDALFKITPKGHLNIPAGDDRLSHDENRRSFVWHLSNALLASQLCIGLPGLAFGCLGKKDLLNAKCEALCVRDGYASGRYEKSCLCFDDKGSIDDYLSRRVHLGPQERRGKLTVTTNAIRDQKELTEENYYSDDE